MKRISFSVVFTWFVLLGTAYLASTGHKHGKPTPTPTTVPTPSPTPSIPKVTLAWNPSSTADGYHLWMGFASGQETLEIDTGLMLIWTLQLNGGTTYYFYVTAYNSGGDSLPSNEVSYTTP